MPPNNLPISSNKIPICLVQNYNLVTPRRQGHFLLREHLYLVPHDIDTPAIIR